MSVAAQSRVDYRGETVCNAGIGNFAPYGIMSNRYGTITQPATALVRGAAALTADSIKSLKGVNISAGLDLIAETSEGTTYDRYLTTVKWWTARELRPAPMRVQQLYAGVEYRNIEVCLGMKERPSAMLNDSLSSGDFTRGINARPMPGLSVGFNRFVTMPWTKGALQFKAELFYGRPIDDSWVESHFNYYNGAVTANWWYNYKMVHLRTDPSRQFCLTFGAQAACQWGFDTRRYYMGQLQSVESRHANLLTPLEMLLPLPGEGYITGNHLGSWDFMARWRTSSGHTIKAYFQGPWEDGSGLARQNGWDGLWGLEYRSASPYALITGAVVEYLDFTNQGGPIHWAPQLNPGTTLTDQATGSDDYYNHINYNGYAYYGMSLGTPFLPSPIYNRTGALWYHDTIIHGMHAAVMGHISPTLAYRAMGVYRKGLGTYDVPRFRPVYNFSCAVEGIWYSRSLPGLKVSLTAAADRGLLIGSNIGAALSIAYSGSFNINRR